MNRQDIRDRARIFFGQTDPNNTQLTDTQLNLFIFDWLKDMAVWMERPRAEATFNGGSISGQMSYPIDTTKVLKILAVDYNEEPLTKVTVDFMDKKFPSWRSDNSGDPEFAFMLDTDVLGLYPKPKENSKTIRTRYVKVPTNFSNDSEELDHVPESMQHLGAFYTAAMALFALKDYQAGRDMLAIYTKKRQELREPSDPTLDTEGWVWVGESEDDGVD